MKIKNQLDMHNDYLIGVALSAKQAEGSKNRSLTVADIQDFNPQNTTKVKGDFSLEEIMDRVNNPHSYTFPKKTGINFYESYKSDLKLLNELGIETLRLSISWSRIFPNLEDDNPNEKGLAFYKEIFELLKEYNIIPIVTIYHDDMPLDIALKYNGFTTKQGTELYLKYAKTVLDHFHSYVEYWIPVNQINLTRVGLSSMGVIKDTIEDLASVKQQGVHNKFVACALLKQYAIDQGYNLKFGSMLADFYVSPLTCKPEDIELATLKNRYTMFYYSDVQIRGQYPQYMLNYFEENNIKFSITEDETELLSSYPMDFIAISYYNSNVVSAKQNSFAIGDSVLNPYLEANEWGWTINALGLYNTLVHFWDRYQTPMMIAENGYGAVEEPGENQVINDDYRISYIKDHLDMITRAHKEGIPVFAYCLWSPIDMVSSGTSEMRKRYGIIYNDLNDYSQGSQKRTPKKSFYWYQKVIVNKNK